MSSHAPYGEPRAKSTRFLPPDPGVEAPYRLTPGLAFRVGILGVVALAVFAVLFFRLWSLQVLSGDTYLAAAQGNQLRTIRIEAPRGTILDRNGRVIVDNVAGTAVKLWVGDLPANRRYAVIRRLAAVLRVPATSLAKEVDERVADPLNPITVKTAVGEDQVAYLYEHQSEFPGVQIQQTYLRHYPYQSLAAQVLGYVGEVSQSDLDRKPKVYKPGDKVGQGGRRGEARRVAPRRGGPGTDPGRLDGTSAGAARAAARGARRERGAPDDRHRVAAGGRACAAPRDPDCACQRVVLRERWGARRARPARRGRARHGLDPHVQAVRVRRSCRPEEDPAAPRRRGREEGELPWHQPRDER